ncbi:MAG TPA: ComEC/Rec2 family competence protein [Candidatus Sulfomarinibacteraceae bacterium]|nr:ComEC/Rec2 family competence protein [Candidatus Sulfomarinibacteraceae bacterium]
MPGSGRLAIGALTAAALTGAAGGAAPGVAMSIVFVASALAVAGWLAVTWLGRRGAGWAIATLAAGAGMIALRLLAAPPHLPPIDVGLPAGTGPWTAQVVSIGPLRDGDRPAVVGLLEPAGLRLAATFPAWPMVVPGDVVEIDGELEPRPDGEYGAYLLRIGAAGIVRARSVAPAPASAAEETAGAANAPAGVGRAMEGLRRGADEALARAIPEPEAGLASGIVIGLRDRVDRDLAADFTTVGATHVIAISGWNIAIVAATLGALAGRVARRRRAALTLVAIGAYVVFVGATPSVVRAATMAGVVLLARELGRPSHAAAAIGWAVTLMLLADPALVDDVGFRLSALATAGLIAWGSPLAARFAGSTPGRLRGWLAESLGVSLAAQLATLPIVAFEFGRLSIIAPVVGLGVVPLVAPAMAAAALALVAGALTLAGAPMFLATLGGLPAWALLAAMVALVRAGASIPFASLSLDPPWDVTVAAVAAVAIVGADRLLRRRDRARSSGTNEQVGRPPNRPAGEAQPGPRSRGSQHGRRGTGRTEPTRLVAGGLAAAVAALAIAIVHRPDGIARLTVLDVGQGDAILLEGQRGSRLLIDGGPDPGRLLVALDERLPPWDRRIDVVVLSHPHEDHAAGLAALLGRYAVERVLEPGMIGPGPGYVALNAAVVAGGVERGILATGDRLVLDDIRLGVLWPDPGAVPERPGDDGTGINNVSIVFLGEAGRHRFLLTGDIEEGVDPTLVARGLPEVDVLKVAHHGSRTASTEPFLAALRPAVAVISAGRRNPYGHPTAEAIGRLEATGARVIRTDRDGTVELELGDGRIRVRSNGPRGVAAADEAKATAAFDNPASTAAFVCGIGPPATAPAIVIRDPGASHGVAGGIVIRDPGASRGGAGAAAAVIRRPLADAPETLRYHAGRDPLDPDAAGWTADGRARRLLLGRRRVRDRCRGGGHPERSDAVPGRRPGAMAPPRRSDRLRPTPRRAPRAARDRHDVRVRDPGGAGQRRSARPAC